MKTRGKKSSDTVPLKRKAVLPPGSKAALASDREVAQAADFKTGLALERRYSYIVSPDKAKVAFPKEGMCCAYLCSLMH